MGEQADADVGYAPQENAFLVHFRNLPEKSASTVRFFERSGSNDSYYYTVYGPDATLTAVEFFKSLGHVKSFGQVDRKLEYLNLQRSAFESFVRDLLLVKQYKVEVFTNKSKSGHNWSVEYKGSPGNLTQFEELLFSNNDVTVNNGVIGVKIGVSDKNKVVGIAHVNTNEGIINLIEFIDSESLTNFESILVQFSPKEAVILSTAANADDKAALTKILDRNRVLINEKGNADFDSKDIVQDMTRLLRRVSSETNNFASNPAMENKLALSAMASVIKYLELVSNESYFEQFKLEPFDFRLYVKMDSAACRALHLGLNSMEDKSAGALTLTATIDKCRTPQGHRLLAQYLKQPLVDREKLEERLDLVEILVDDVHLRQSLYEDNLRRIPDCHALAKKFMKKKGALQDYYKGYLCVSKLGRLVRLLTDYDGPKKAVLDSVFTEPFQSLHDDFIKYIDLIEQTLDLDSAERGDFIVRPEIDSSLGDLRVEMDGLIEKMCDEGTEVAKRLNMEFKKSLKLEYNGMHGYFFRITLKDETTIRNDKKFKVLDSNKAGVRFRNDDLERLNEKHSKKHRVYEDRQKDFVKELIETASGYYESFEQLGYVTATLDVITSFAVSSVSNAETYIRPKLLPRGTGKIQFQNLRHPCVETQIDVTYIPNDINFEKGKESFYIVTGPNMGGKSTFLRSVGVATLLAHVGCFVPASYAEVSMVDAILARVGAGDCLSKGISTFMAEMIEASFIIKTATSDSLVLIDELGRGTSTYDGFGLCWAISEHLSKNVDCYCILATHFHELTDLANEVPSVQNLHVVAVTDENGLEMLYKLQRGACDRSFGLHVAKVTGFPDDVLEEAQKMARRLEDFSSETDLDDSEEAVLRRKKEKKEGQEIIDKFLDRVKGIAQCSSNEAEFQAQLQCLINEVKASDSPYIQHILTTIE